MPEFGWPCIYIEDDIEAMAVGEGPVRYSGARAMGELESKARLLPLLLRHLLRLPAGLRSLYNEWRPEPRSRSCVHV